PSAIYASCTSLLSFFLLLPPPPTSPLFPYTTLFRSHVPGGSHHVVPSRQHSHVKPAPRSPSSASSCISGGVPISRYIRAQVTSRSEEHTSELQSRFDLVCRLLLEKKKKKQNTHTPKA